MKQLGLPTQAQSLQTVSIASRARNALFTLTTYKDNITMLQLQQNHDSAMLNPPLQPWIDNSITMHLHRAVLRTQPLLTHITDNSNNPQRQLTKLLLPQTHTVNLHKLLAKRWTRFFVTIDLQPAIHNALHNFNRLSTMTKQCVLISILKTWLYAWTTNNRFGNYNQPCPICHKPNSDTLRHFYNCHPLSAAAKRVFHQPYLPTTRDYFFLSHDYNNSHGHTDHHLKLNAIHIQCITKTYHHIKHHQHEDITDTYKAQLKQLLQHDPRLVATYQLAQRHNLYNPRGTPLPLPTTDHN